MPDLRIRDFIIPVALVRGEIQAMSAPDRDGLLLEYKTFAIATNKLPSIIKKVEKGEWQSGLVLGELMRFYWKKTRNTEWTATATSSRLNSQIKQLDGRVAT